MTTEFHNDQRYELVRTELCTRTDGGVTELSDWQSECPACVSDAVIIAQLIGDDRAQAGDIVAKSRAPIFTLGRELVASWSSSPAPKPSQPAKPTTGAGKSEATWAPDSWTFDADAFECCCAVCSSQD